NIAPRRGTRYRLGWERCPGGNPRRARLDSRPEEMTMNAARTVGPRWWWGFACVLAMSAVIAIAQEPARTQGGKPGSGPAKRASIYDKAADAQVQVAKAVERAKRGDKRVLLMFGGDWCGWCHKLHDLFETNREVAQILSNEYELVTIDLE